MIDQATQPATPHPPIPRAKGHLALFGLGVLPDVLQLFGNLRLLHLGHGPRQ